jgi:hypothetical protein
MAAGDDRGRREGATRERCPRDVGIGAQACHDSGRMAGVTTRDPLDQNVSHERGVVRVECGRSKMAKSEMSVQTVFATCSADLPLLARKKAVTHKFLRRANLH